MEKEVGNMLAVLDVLVNSNSLNLQTTSDFSFTSFSYKMGLVRTLVGRVYKIHNS